MYQWDWSPSFVEEIVVFAPSHENQHVNWMIEFDSWLEGPAVIGVWPKIMPYSTVAP
jgi:hypothetical protein